MVVLRNASACTKNHHENKQDSMDYHINRSQLQMSKEKGFYIPLHCLPFPLNPVLHSHAYDPIVFAQVALL